MVGHQSLIARGVKDDDRVETVPRGAPFVLLHVPRRHGLDRAAVIQPGGEVIDQALRQRGDRPDLLQGGKSVADPHLDGAEIRHRPDVPADFVRDVDHAGGEHVRHVLLVLFPGGELEGEPGRRELLEHQRALGSVTGIFTIPERRRRRERLEVREIVDQSIQYGQRLGPLVQSDVHVDAVDHHLPAPPLGAVDQGGVACLVRDCLCFDGAEGMRTGTEKFDAEWFSDFADRVHRPGQVCLRLGHGGADASDELDGVGEQLLLDVRVLVVVLEFRVLLPDAAEHLIRGGHELAGFAIHQCQFPLNAEGRLGR